MNGQKAHVNLGHRMVTRLAYVGEPKALTRGFLEGEVGRDDSNKKGTTRDRLIPLDPQQDG